jgi:hypothetical protein
MKAVGDLESLALRRRFGEDAVFPRRGTNLFPYPVRAFLFEDRYCPAQINPQGDRGQMEFSSAARLGASVGKFVAYS